MFNFCRLSHTSLTAECCQDVSSVLMSLRDLDLSNNDLQDAGVKVLCAALGREHCRLETFRWATPSPAHSPARAAPQHAHTSPTCCFVFLQVVRLLDRRGRLLFSGVGSEVQPVPAERAGPELQPSGRVRSEAALCCTGGSKGQAGHSQVFRGKA